MNLSVGIVGLPNVGKSTLFNALLKKQQALAANYPFATIEPNVGIVPVPDDRLNDLANITKEEEGMTNLPPIKPAMVEFVDIAGLVKGASVGEGLGNKFLSHIREVKVIAHVVRAFEDEDVIREGSHGVKEDYSTIQTELLLSDLQTIANVKLKTKNKIVDKIEENLNKGIPVSALTFNDEEMELVNALSLLSAKPQIIVLNVAESDYIEDKFQSIISKYSEVLESKDPFVVVSAKIESELADLGEEDAKGYLKELGVEKSGLERLINKSYEKLGLMSFLTCGEKEVRAWTIKIGSTAVEAAGEIHTDFMDKFIKAEVVPYKDFAECNGWKGSREKGKAGLHGKDYIMKDGDVVEFKIGR